MQINFDTTWSWLIFGMILMAIEIFIPSFTIFWFGLGALIVGILLFITQLSFSIQILLWILFSSFFAFLWFKYLKKLLPDRTKAGVAKEAIIGETGQVIKVPIEKQHGLVRFTTPILGDDEWEFICNSEVTLGDRVFIKEISGNTLIVEKK